MAEHSKQSVDEAPRAIIHKRILDAARDDPTASIDGIADDIAAATPELVEKVLEEYGDPGTAEGGQSTETDGTADSPDDPVPAEADEQTAASETEESVSAVSTDGGEGGDTGADAPSPIDRAELSSTQTETLRAIARRPSATQAEIAGELGVVRATVCNRLRDIDGFDWESRERLVATLFDDLDSTEQPDTAAPSTSEGSESSTGDEGTAKGRADEPSVSAVDAKPDTDTSSADDETTDDTSAEEMSPTKSTADHGSSDEPTVEEAETDDTADVDRHEVASRLDALETTVAALEADDTTGADEMAATTLSRADGGTATGADPELLHKAVQAIVDDDRISETEEIRLLRHVL